MKLERCAIYIRVSTAEQMIHGKSLEAQREYLETYAREHNMVVAGVYADEGKTARKELKKRKAIHALLEDVKAGKIDVIIFWRLDRWFRNLSDFYKVQDVLDSHNVRWISTSEPGINMGTRDGRLQLNVVLSIGQNEVDTTSERIKFVNESSIRSGKLIFGDVGMAISQVSLMDRSAWLRILIENMSWMHFINISSSIKISVLRSDTYKKPLILISVSES